MATNPNVKKLKEKYEVISIQKQVEAKGETFHESVRRCKFCCRIDYCNNYLIQKYNGVAAHYDRPWEPNIGMNIPIVHVTHCPALVNRTPAKDRFYRNQRKKYGFDADLPEVQWAKDLEEYYKTLAMEGQQTLDETVNMTEKQLEDLETRIENEHEKEQEQREMSPSLSNQNNNINKDKKPVEKQVKIPMDIRQQKEFAMEMEFRPDDNRILVKNHITKEIEEVLIMIPENELRTIHNIITKYLYAKGNDNTTTTTTNQ